MSATSNWLDFSGNSNLSNPTYMIGFLDISSGNVILRNSNLFLKSGDASLGGRLFVNGDVSLNGRLYAPINSIPASAIIGGGGATFTNTQGSFASNNSVVTMTLDVSAANTLDVSGIMAVSTALGVGVTNPQYQVDVGGGGIGCGRMAQFGAGGAATTPANNITTNIITGTFTGPITTTGDASLNGRLFVGADSSLNGNIAVGGNLSVNGNLSVKSYTQTNILNTLTTNTFSVIEDLSLNGRILVSGDASLNGRLFVSGNVGIGTTNATYKLDVRGSNLSLTSSGTNVSQNMILAADIGTGGTYAQTCGGFLQGGTVYNQSTYLALGTCAGTQAATTSERMRIVDTGNVGIGTTNPAYTLDVNGVINTNSAYNLSYTSNPSQTVNQIGYSYYNASSAEQNIPYNSLVTNICSITLPIGVYIITGSVSVNAPTVNYAGATVGLYQNGSSVQSWFSTCTTYVYQSVNIYWNMLVPSNSTVYSLRAAMHNGTATAKVGSYIAAIRIA
jgi:hypothetical protein